MNIKIDILDVPKHGNKHNLIHFVTDSMMLGLSIQSDQLLCSLPRQYDAGSKHPV